jgi:hypothetical protein
VTLLHGRWRARVSLLASQALDGPELEATRAHLDRCERCRREYEELATLLAAAAPGPGRGDVPLPPLDLLVARVQASLDSAAPRRAVPVAGRWLWPTAAAGAAAALALMVWLPRGATPPADPRPPVTPQVSMPGEMIDRLERSLARQHAARYLSQAQAVLVNVSSPPDCDRTDASVDVEQEARQSRELLSRRALLVELDGDPVMSARPVIEDVDTMLREVAALPSCARPRDIEAIHREIARRRLLMKIDLMTRELVG